MCLRNRLFSVAPWSPLLGILVYAVASTVLRVLVKDFNVNCWCLEVPLDNCIRHVPGCVYNRAQNFRLEAFKDLYV
jgi:hypothetical protein